MEIYDHTPAHTIEELDPVFVYQDYVLVSRTVDETDTIMIEGISEITGDAVTYMMPADMEVGLWRY